MTQVRLIGCYDQFTVNIKKVEIRKKNLYKQEVFFTNKFVCENDSNSKELIDLFQ